MSKHRKSQKTLGHLPLELPLITRKYISSSQEPESGKNRSFSKMGHSLTESSFTIDRSLLFATAVIRASEKILRCPGVKYHYKSNPEINLEPQISAKILSTSCMAQKIHTKLPVVRLKKSKVPRAVRILPPSKTTLFLDFAEKVRLSNGVSLREQHTRYFKYSIRSGNNSELVRRTLKRRFWWVSSNSYKKANLIWTPLRKAQVFRRLPNAAEKHAESSPVSISQNFRQSGHNLVLESRCFIQLKPTLQSESFTIANKLPGNKHLCCKKYLFSNLKAYYESVGQDVFSTVPLTFHITQKNRESAIQSFQSAYHANASLFNMWIIKPGESSNRGHGISLASSYGRIQSILHDGSCQTYILQKYIENPLLYNNRKFDIRCYVLVTSVNGNIQGYFYQDGYIRTSSYEFSMDSCDKLIHLTNDAVQKQSNDYGRFETGNKLTYNDLQRFLDRNAAGVDVQSDILPQIRRVVADTLRATYSKIDPERKKHGFELFGYDVMIDQRFKVWLIEVNTNPCLEESCKILSRLLGSLMHNVWGLVLDPMFPPPRSSKKLEKWCEENWTENRFELIFSENGADC